MVKFHVKHIIYLQFFTLITIVKSENLYLSALSKYLRSKFMFKAQYFKYIVISRNFRGVLRVDGERYGFFDFIFEMSAKNRKTLICFNVHRTFIFESPKISDRRKSEVRRAKSDFISSIDSPQNFGFVNMRMLVDLFTRYL